MARGTPARLAEEECHLRLQAVHAGALQRLAAALAAAVEEEARGQRRCILKHLHQQPACAVARAALDPGAPLARGGRAGRAATGARTQRVWPLAQVEEDVLPVEVALGQVGQRVRVGPAGQVRVPPGALEHLRGAARRGAPAQLARSSGWSVRFQRLPSRNAPPCLAAAPCRSQSSLAGCARRRHPRKSASSPRPFTAYTLPPSAASKRGGLCTLPV